MGLLGVLDQDRGRMWLKIEERRMVWRWKRRMKGLGQMEEVSLQDGRGPQTSWLPFCSTSASLYFLNS